MRGGRMMGLLAACLMLAGGAARAEPVKIRIAWVIPVGNWASILYEKKDLMTHYGKTYEVEPVHFQSTPAMISALATGQLEIADLAYSAFGIAVENAGLTDLRIIADEGQDGAHGHRSSAYYVLKDGPVKTIDDLKGKVLATVAVGSAVDIPVRALLRRHGLESPRDYTVVEAGFPNMNAMLLDHKVDFIPSVEPYALDPRLLENGRILFRIEDALGGPTQLVVWTARAGFIAEHRAAMVDLLEDAIRAVHFLLDPKNHDEVVGIAARLAHQPPAAVAYAFTSADGYRDPNMLPDIPTFQRALDAQHGVGLLKAPLNAADYADVSLVKEAAARAE